ncbi:hypothetical protein CC78DRAFT_536640 [Lojkania enalia]|uniref:Uncharacterized protein n=1 Tax=Lojkania enalia TaxID=147567 RepID=A0A9P4MZ75_9PLEO|nr:hypothetical protein CC78DRAFT_536640 [Didymosphaeria enalia]
MPITSPSPYRFITRETPAPKPKPQSNLRHGSSAPDLKYSLKGIQNQSTTAKESIRVIPAKRFVLAPDRGVPSLPGESDDEVFGNIRTQPQDTPRPKPWILLERVESIEETSQESLAASLKVQDSDRVLTIPVEDSHLAIDDEAGCEDDGDAEILFTPHINNKRRRLSPPLGQPSSPIWPSTSPLMHPPQTPIIGQVRYQPPTTSASHRFLIPAARTPASISSVASTSSNPAPAPNRPHFIFPQPVSPQQHAQPLPEHFSPSRKGQKYIPGGLAWTLQSWIIEAANTGYAAQSRDAVIWGRDKEDGVKLKLKISSVRGRKGDSEDGDIDCFPNSIAFVRGDKDAGVYNLSRMTSTSHRGGEGKTRLLLGRQGGTRSSGGVKVKIGDVIGIRAPFWDVDIGNEKWTVGVDWVIL